MRVIQSSNKNVKKYVWAMVAESVLYKYPTYKERTVICCSTQSGCPVGCRFCGADDAFVRSLTAEEIVSQPVQLLSDACKEEGINVGDIQRLQIMFMSMGEPMLNLGSLIPALYELYERYPQAALLVSTIGPNIDYSAFMEVAKDIPTIGLQFSVHETTNGARNKLIPFAAKMALAGIAQVGEEFYHATDRQPFFNYCVGPHNGTDDDADRLARLFSPNVWQATISVICEHVAASNERALALEFRHKLATRGFQTRVAGQDDTGSGSGTSKNGCGIIRPWLGQALEVQ